MARLYDTRSRTTAEVVDLGVHLDLLGLVGECSPPRRRTGGRFDTARAET
jgi:hypothetical protein